MLSSSLFGGGIVADDSGGFVSPSTNDFYWPLIQGNANVFTGDSNWAITRPAVMFVLSVFLIAWFFMAGRKLSVVPGKRQWIVEQAYGLVRNTIGSDVIGSDKFRPFLPLLCTVFSLVLLNNLFGIIPFIQYPSTSRIGFPIVMTLVVYIVYHVVALRAKGGVGGYMKTLVPPGVPGALVPLMWILEFATYFIIRPVTLALRLFGNMMAGHLLILVFVLGGEYLLLHSGSVGLAGAGILSLLFAIVMSFFELLVQFLQAFIFAMLTALYLSDSLAESH
ncbi:MAG: F0F1 ATP synthase subunit A [Dermatophilaceae bacterium]